MLNRSCFRSSDRALVEAASRQPPAASRSQAIIEFDLDGNILHANENFLGVMGYRDDEVVGRQHAMFVDPDEAGGQAYRAFWDSLRCGEFKSTEFRRLAKGGRDV